jgi:tetratricopeptide (TPR) repeat protein
VSFDVWGEPMDSSSPESVEAWNGAWAAAMHFTGDPFDVLAKTNLEDEVFSLGSVFCGVYRVLGGTPLDSPELVGDLDRARRRAVSPRERAHVEALEHLVAGEFTLAAKHWDQIVGGGLDFAAVRFAHDIYLHVGDAARRLQSSQRAVNRWLPDDPSWSFVLGQHAFSLEEAGFYNEAEELARQALDADPLDLWALHALAHVYETIDDGDASFELLRGREQTWSTQDQLSVHIWWHLALRLIADRQFDEALRIHDRLVPESTTPFRLCDLASMLWRLELSGVDVGGRWENLADAFDTRPERHTTGFLDLHAAMVYARQPDHPAARVFFDGVHTSHAEGAAENDDTFRRVVAPLVDAIRTSNADPQGAATMLESVDAHLHRIGGSIAQRDIVALTRQSLESTVLEDT